MIRLHHDHGRGHYAMVMVSGQLRHITAYHPTAVEAMQDAEQWGRGVGRLKVGPQARPKKEWVSDGADEG